MPRLVLWMAVLAWTVAGCGDDDEGGDGPKDDAAAQDASRDGGSDGGIDANIDSGARDASPDADARSPDAASPDDASAASDADAASDATTLDGARDDASPGDAASTDDGSPGDGSTDDAAPGDAAGPDAASTDDTSSGDASTDAIVGDGGALESFTSIYDDIISPRCAGCHGTPHASNLDLRTRVTAYEELYEVDAAGSGCGNEDIKRVAPGNADDSLLVQKLERDSADVCGNHMPSGGQASLSETEIARIRLWIDQGALDN